MSDGAALVAPAGWLPANVHDTLRTGFAVGDATTRSVSRTWLDTFDWRLHRAGLRLVQERVGRRSHLLLIDTHGAVIATHDGAPRWPARPADLADPVRAVLEPIVEMRALLPVGELAELDERLDLRDEQAKLVARVQLQTENGAPDGPGPVSVRVTPVRGYQAEADRARGLLVAAGAEPGRGDGFERAVRAGGRRVGDYTNKLLVALVPAAPAARSVADILLAVLDGIEDNVAGTVADVDTEYLHDLRVNVRRTRAALKLIGDVLPDDLAARFAEEFRWLGGLTSPVRDLDVHLLELDAITDLEGLAPLRAHLLGRRRRARRALVSALRSDRFKTLVTEWRAELVAVVETAGGEPATAQLAARRIAHANRKLVRRGRLITDDSPAELLHALRKRGKELRYALEFFAALHDPRAHRKVVEELKQLQDCLGRFQDAELQRHALYDFAAQMSAAGTADPTTLLAMGELAGRLDTREVARREFADRFERFVGPANQRRLAALTAVGVRA